MVGFVALDPSRLAQLGHSVGEWVVAHRSTGKPAGWGGGVQGLEVKGIRLGVRWAETLILLEQSYEASVSVLLVGDVKYLMYLPRRPPGCFLETSSLYTRYRSWPGDSTTSIWHGVWCS